VLSTLITNKTRIKLLVKFFLNPGTKGYLRSLATEFNESTNAIRLELNKFEEANLLSSEVNGNKKYYEANPEHPLYDNIRGLVTKHLGIDTIVDKLVERLGNLDKVYLTGELAEGIESNIIDLIIVGDNINREYLTEVTYKAEEVLGKKIRNLIYGSTEYEMLGKDGRLLLWER
jgi:hypothetical protein